MEKCPSVRRQKGGRQAPIVMEEDFDNESTTSDTQTSYRQSSILNSPETNEQNDGSTDIIDGYPIYDNQEACIVYKLAYAGFNEANIHMKVTADYNLVIRAKKRCQGSNLTREFERTIQLEPELDADVIVRNKFYKGVLTINIFKKNHFEETYNDDGKLAKLTSDFKRHRRESVKIELSAENVIVVKYFDLSLQRECMRTYQLPAYDQSEVQMAMRLHTDGVLSVHFDYDYYN